ncbi:MAG: thiamine-phosphate kinase [Pyrinomonadaceae bacterium]|nr:thiamine-phosphate kinase [Pyrinomonadaceae bacterium]
MRGEFDFIETLRRRTERQAKAGNVSLGIGDDAAVVNSKNTSLVITADLLVEEIDFRLDWTTPQFLGHKALAVSLSDIAAMGARPRFALLSLGVPQKIWRTKFVDQFYEGFFRLARDHSVALIGGDTSRTPDRIVIDSIVLGEAQHNRVTRRSGAKPGDLIYVTGMLGGAAAGLRLLQSGKKIKIRTRSNGASRTTKLSAQEKLLRRQLLPSPRVRWGRLLGEKNLATAMIDLSDGLSSDLAHLCRASGVGAVVDASLIPVDSSISVAPLKEISALDLALHGGEDYELLFTVRPRKRALLPQKLGGINATLIGEITSSKRIEIVREGHTRALKPEGFQHFRRALPRK